MGLGNSLGKYLERKIGKFVPDRYNRAVLQSADAPPAPSQRINHRRLSPVPMRRPIAKRTEMPVFRTSRTYRSLLSLYFGFQLLFLFKILTKVMPRLAELCLLETCLATFATPNCEEFLRVMEQSTMWTSKHWLIPTQPMLSSYLRFVFCKKSLKHLDENSDG